MWCHLSQPPFSYMHSAYPPLHYVLVSPSALLLAHDSGQLYVAFSRVTSPSGYRSPTQFFISCNVIYVIVLLDWLRTQSHNHLFFHALTMCPSAFHLHPPLLTVYCFVRRFNAVRFEVSIHRIMMLKCALVVSTVHYDCNWCFPQRDMVHKLVRHLKAVRLLLLLFGNACPVWEWIGR